MTDPHRTIDGMRCPCCVQDEKIRAVVAEVVAEMPDADLHTKLGAVMSRMRGAANPAIVARMLRGA